MNKKSEKLIHIPGIAGADEAGRGPLAGPVVAAAVILPDDFKIDGLDDSKKMDRSSREIQAIRIQANARYAIESVSPEEIDRLNILWASMEAMERAIRKISPSRVLIDGNRLPKQLPCAAEAIVKGDGIYACIAAASILAKVTRDRLMIELAKTYPGYGFETHYGYPTPDHLAALKRLGPCPIHRRSFGPVRDSEQLCLIDL
jgi:ribonuclease HII